MSDRGSHRENAQLSRRALLGGAAALVGGTGLTSCSEQASSKSFHIEPATRSQYELVKAEGSHRELGRQHGEQASESIRMHLDHIARTQKLSQDAMQTKALKFVELFQQYCPHLLDEIEGLAEGAGITLAEGLACNLRGELGKAPDEGCTTYVIGKSSTGEKEILVGQNSDMSQPNIEMGYMLHLKPIGKPQVLIWTFGGMIGYHGMNSVGVAHFANSLGGGPAGQFGLSHYPVKRMMLECSRVSEVLDLFQRVPLASNGNYVLCDGAGTIIDIEANTNGPQIVDDSHRGYIAHTNHYLWSALRHAGELRKESCRFVPAPGEDECDDRCGEGQCQRRADQAVSERSLERRGEHLPPSADRRSGVGFRDGGPDGGIDDCRACQKTDARGVGQPLRQ